MALHPLDRCLPLKPPKNPELEIPNHDELELLTWHCNLHTSPVQNARKIDIILSVGLTIGYGGKTEALPGGDSQSATRSQRLLTASIAAGTVPLGYKELGVNKCGLEG